MYASASSQGAPQASTNSKGRSNLPTIVGIATSNPDFSTLVLALQKAGLVSTFNDNRHFTVFAPTNAAFDAAAAQFNLPNGPALIAALDVQTLTAILTFHLTRGDRNSTSVVSAGKVRMLDGNTATVTASGGVVKIENATIIATDIRASNGIIHVRAATWSIGVSILMIVAGILALAAPLFAGLAITAALGWLLLLSGILHFAFAWRSHTAQAVIREILVGIVYGWVGLYLLTHPVRGLVSLTLVLAVYLLMEGCSNSCSRSSSGRRPRGAGCCSTAS